MAPAAGVLLGLRHLIADKTLAAGTEMATPDVDTPPRTSRDEIRSSSLLDTTHRPNELPVRLGQRCSTHSRMSLRVIAPDFLATSLPPLKRIMVGMLRMPSRVESS